MHNKNNSLELTDDSKLMRDNPKEFKIKYILDNCLNLKITQKEDLEVLKTNFYLSFTRKVFPGQK